jgi:hypothetical protein
MTPANLIQALFSMELPSRSNSSGGRAHNGHVPGEAPFEAGKLKPRIDPRRFSQVTLDDAHPAIEPQPAAGANVVDIRSRRRIAR